MRKRNKIQVDKGSKFSNSFFKKWFKDNDIGMYLLHHVGKSVAAERLINSPHNLIYYTAVLVYLLLTLNM